MKDEPKTNYEILAPFQEPMIPEEISKEWQITDISFSGPLNRRRVPVYIHDIEGLLQTKMTLNIDKNSELFILSQSIEQILKHLEQKYQRLTSSTVEAITKEGIRSSDFHSLDIDSIEVFHVI